MFSVPDLGAAVHGGPPRDSNCLCLVCVVLSQHGINNATNGDTVIVAPGTYSGSNNNNVDTLGKAISVIGSGGQDVQVTGNHTASTGVPSTTIACGGPPTAYGQITRGFVVHSGEGPGTVISGFTIDSCFAAGSDLAAPDQFGIAGGDSMGGGLYIVSSSPTIQHMRVENGWVSGQGGNAAIAGPGAAPRFFDVLLGSGYASQNGGALTVHTNGASFNGVLVEGNRAGQYGGGIALMAANATLNLPTVVVNSTIRGNYASSHGGGIFILDGHIVLGVQDDPNFAVVGCPPCACDHVRFSPHLVDLVRAWLRTDVVGQYCRCGGRGSDGSISTAIDIVALNDPAQRRHAWRRRLVVGRPCAAVWRGGGWQRCLSLWRRGVLSRQRSGERDSRQCDDKYGRQRRRHRRAVVNHHGAHQVLHKRLGVPC